MDVFEIVFSPTGGTRKVSGLVAGALDKNTVTVDLTDSGLDFSAVFPGKTVVQRRLDDDDEEHAPPDDVRQYAESVLPAVTRQWGEEIIENE